MSADSKAANKHAWKSTQICQQLAYIYHLPFFFFPLFLVTESRTIRISMKNTQSKSKEGKKKSSQQIKIDL